MTERKLLNGRLNFDASGYFVPDGDYSDAVDIRITPRGLVSMEGNRIFSEYYTAPDYWCACSHKDNTRRRVYAILCRDDQKHRFIYCDLDTLSITQMFENITNTGGADIFGWGMGSAFDPSKAMKGMKIIYRDFGGDLIYFIDPNHIPLKFNDASLIAGDYGTSPTLEMFKVMKYTPAAQPTAVYTDDPSRSVNNLRKKLFEFKIQYVTIDDETSTWSAVSNLPLPPKNEDQEYYLNGTKANVIKVVLTTGNKTIKKINIAARVNNGSVWDDFALIDVIDKEKLFLSDNSSYEYFFYNDGAYNYIDINESGLLFDYVPDKANAQELVDGRVIAYGGITEGLDKEIELNVATTIGSEGASSLGVTYVETTNSPSRYAVTLSGTPNTGDYFEVNLLVVYDDGINPPTQQAVTANYTATIGNTLDTVINTLVSSLNTNFPSEVLASNESSPDNTLQIDPVGIRFYTTRTFQIIGTPVGGSDSVAALKWSGRYGFGIAYYSSDGKTRGVHVPSNDSWTVDMPNYSEAATIAQVPYVQLKISNAPPSWADYFHIVMTQELTAIKSKYFISGGCDQDSDFSYINIQNLTVHTTDFPSTAATLLYDFAEGDRIKLIKKMPSTLLSNYDFEVLGVVTRSSVKYIKIKKTASVPSFAIATDRFLFEVYSPSKLVSNELNVYYEVAERYLIFTDANGNKSHAGKSQAQVRGTGAQPSIIKILAGDYYVRSRKLTTGASGVFTDGTYTCMDQNFSDFWQSGVWGQGRALVIDETIKEQFYPGLVRFGLPYLSGSSTNDLSRFHPANQVEANAAYGAILNMKARENFIRVFQRYKVSMMPVYRQMIYDATGTQTVGLSSQVLSKPDYYIGDYGIDKYGLSLVSTDFGDYFIDDINNALVRISNDGITNISDTYSAKNWSNVNILNGYSGFGGFHYEERLVFMAIVDDNGDVANVISFSETYKGFNSKHSFTNAENILFADGYLWTFKGVPYVHDRYNCNYYGVQYAPSVTVTFNKGVDFKKNFVSVGTVSNRKWGCPEILTSTGQNSELWIDDFRMREDGYHAGLLRDKASPKGLLRGDPLKGNWVSVRFEAGYTEAPLGNILIEPTPVERDTSTDSVLTLASVTYNESNLNKR